MISRTASAIILAFLVTPAFGQQATSSAASAAQSDSSQQTTQAKKKQSEKNTNKPTNDRMFYVMPNYLTVQNEAEVQPLTWKGKFDITARGAFDPYEFAIVGVLAGIRQAHDAYPAFGEGAAGYGKRYGAAFADQVDGNMMVGAVFPSILRTDPRYYQLSHGRFIHRFGYALSRILISRSDSGRNVFNISEFAGNGVAAGISNLYYPAQDRSASSTVSNWGTQLSVDGFGNELKEFWPDIHRKLHKRKNQPAAGV
ncbi:MAG: hypothetical protein WBE20_10680 [Candidatus Acidiferrales bacterium]